MCVCATISAVLCDSPCSLMIMMMIKITIKIKDGERERDIERGGRGKRFFR